MWWEVPVLDGSRDTRTFRGEVEIGAGVKPTFIFPRCSVRVRPIIDSHF